MPIKVTQIQMNNRASKMRKKQKKNAESSGSVLKNLRDRETNMGTMSKAEIFKKDASSAHYTYKNPEVILYMIIELSGNTCYDAIARKKPLDIEEYKPYLFDAIRAILQTGKES